MNTEANNDPPEGYALAYVNSGQVYVWNPEENWYTCGSGVQLHRANPHVREISTTVFEIDDVEWDEDKPPVYLAVPDDIIPSERWIYVDKAGGYTAGSDVMDISDAASAEHLKGEVALYDRCNGLEGVASRVWHGEKTTAEELLDYPDLDRHRQFETSMDGVVVPSKIDAVPWGDVHSGKVVPPRRVVMPERTTSGGRMTEARMVVYGTSQTYSRGGGHTVTRVAGDITQASNLYRACLCDAAVYDTATGNLLGHRTAGGWKEVALESKRACTSHTWDPLSEKCIGCGIDLSGTVEQESGISLGEDRADRPIDASTCCGPLSVEGYQPTEAYDSDRQAARESAGIQHAADRLRESTLFATIRKQKEAELRYLETGEYPDSFVAWLKSGKHQS